VHRIHPETDPPLSAEDPGLAKLIASAQGGSTESTAVLYAEFRPLVERVIHRYEHLCLHFGILEDLPGELYVAFATLLRDFEPQRGVSFFQYINRLLPAAVHAAVRQHCRTLARERAIGEHPEEWLHASAALVYPGSGQDAGLTTGELVDRLSLTEALGEALAQLPQRQAEVFWQRAVRQLDFDEIAAAVGTTPGAARTLYITARRRLHRALRDRYPDEARKA
jgi:RNA polymerase sigma-70 factor, ECF subfamily